MTVKIFALLVSLTAGIAVLQADELAEDAVLVSENAACPIVFIAFDALLL